MDRIKKFIIIVLILYFVKSSAAAAAPQNNTTTPKNNATADFIKNLKDSFPDLKKKLNNQTIPTFASGSGNAAAGAIAAEVLAKVLGSKKSGTFKVEDIPELIVEFLGKIILSGLKGLLTPVAFLLIIILKVVEALLNVVIWIVEALLKTILTSLGMGKVGTDLDKTLTEIKDIVDDLLDAVEDLLADLSYVRDIEKMTGTRKKRAITDRPINFAREIARSVGSTVYNRILEPIFSPFEPLLTPIKMAFRVFRPVLKPIFNFLNDNLFTDAPVTLSSRRKRDTAQFTLRQLWKGIKGGAKVSKFAGSTAISLAAAPVTLPIKAAMLPLKAVTIPAKAGIYSTKKVLSGLWTLLTYESADKKNSTSSSSS